MSDSEKLERDFGDYSDCDDSDNSTRSYNSEEKNHFIADDYEDEDFENYMDKYIQNELDAQLQDQIDSQLEQQERMIQNSLKAQLDEAIEEENRNFLKEQRLALEISEIDEDCNIDSMFNRLSIPGESEVELENSYENVAIKKATVADINDVISKAIKTYKNDNE